MVRGEGGCIQLPAFSQIVAIAAGKLNIYILNHTEMFLGKIIILGDFKVPYG